MPLSPARGDRESALDLAVLCVFGCLSAVALRSPLGSSHAANNFGGMDVRR